MEKPIILCFETDAATEAALKKAAARLGADVKSVPLSEYSLPIGAIAGDVKPTLTYLGMPLGEPMLVFVNFPETVFEVFLGSLREKKIAPGILKAVLTEHNAAWTPSELHTELCRERAAFIGAHKK